MRAVHRPLVRSEQPALCEGCDPVNAGKQISWILSPRLSLSLVMALVRVAVQKITRDRASDLRKSAQKPHAPQGPGPARPCGGFRRGPERKV